MSWTVFSLIQVNYSQKRKLQIHNRHVTFPSIEFCSTKTFKIQHTKSIWSFSIDSSLKHTLVIFFVQHRNITTSIHMCVAFPSIQLLSNLFFFSLCISGREGEGGGRLLLFIHFCKLGTWHWMKLFRQFSLVIYFFFLCISGREGGRGGGG